MLTLKQRHAQLQSFVTKNDDKIEQLKRLLRQAASKKEFNTVNRILGIRFEFQHRLANKVANIEDDLKHAPKHILIQEFKRKLKSLDLLDAGVRKQLSNEIKKLDEELKGNGATNEELFQMGWNDLFLRFS